METVSAEKAKGVNLGAFSCERQWQWRRGRGRLLLLSRASSLISLNVWPGLIYFSIMLGPLFIYYSCIIHPVFIYYSWIIHALFIQYRHIPPCSLLFMRALICDKFLLYIVRESRISLRGFI